MYLLVLPLHSDNRGQQVHLLHSVQEQQAGVNDTAAHTGDGQADMLVETIADSDMMVDGDR